MGYKCNNIAICFIFKIKLRLIQTEWISYVILSKLLHDCIEDNFCLHRKIGTHMT